MKCPKCGAKGVRNVVLNKEFYYCRNCKIEIDDDRKEPQDDDADDDSYYDDYWFFASGGVFF